jgi:hypothetical protein
MEIGTSGADADMRYLAWRRGQRKHFQIGLSGCQGNDGTCDGGFARRLAGYAVIATRATAA